MELIEINGIKVLFPYKPYDIQVDYMTAVINCLQQRSNGLLESPTGTGKTLSLLCACLAWLQTMKERSLSSNTSANDNTAKYALISAVKSALNIGTDSPTAGLSPKIIYSSRTHAQLSQAIGELKRSYYKTFSAVVLGSRDQLCINREVNKLDSLAAKNHSCRRKVVTRSCPYYNNYEQKILVEKDSFESRVLDIEDLVKLGNKHSCCPYYASRVIAGKASIVFTPYNYIIDETLRRTQALDLRNSVAIFDEGHNIEQVFEECASSELKADTLSLCITQMTNILKKLKRIDDKIFDPYLNAEDFEELIEADVEDLKMIVCDLNAAIDRIIVTSEKDKTMHKSEEFFELLNRIGIEINTRNALLQTIDKICRFLVTTKSLNYSSSSPYLAAFAKLTDFIETLVPSFIEKKDDYSTYKMEFIKKFKIFSIKDLDEEKAIKSDFIVQKTSSIQWTLHIWCLSPSFGAQSLRKEGIRNFIITSGTLSPLDSFEVEMGIKFPIKLQNTHVIKDNQICITTIGKSSNGTVLTSNYNNKDNMEFYRALGNTLIDLVNTIPNGVLIFFSSYTTLNKCADVWRSRDKGYIWNTINSIKEIFVEPRGREAFADSISKYKIKIDSLNSNGAIYFGVCRGKLAEGLDVLDAYCRAVIMTGLPFPSVADPRIVLKKEYVSELKNKFLTANSWYTLQMKRALNQAIGRVIRHKDDFGAIILCDIRFEELNQGLSKWIEKLMIKDNLDYNDKIKMIKSFFEQHSTDEGVRDSKAQCSRRANTGLKSKVNTEVKNKNDSFEGLISEKSIMHEFNCLPNIKKNNEKSSSKSIFDSLNFESNNVLEAKRSFVEIASFEDSLIDLDNREAKRKKLNVKLRSICDSTLSESLPSTSKINSDNKFKDNNKNSSDKSKKAKNLNDSRESVLAKNNKKIKQTLLNNYFKPNYFKEK